LKTIHFTERNGTELNSRARTQVADSDSALTRPEDDKERKEARDVWYQMRIRGEKNGKEERTE